MEEALAIVVNVNAYQNSVAKLVNALKARQTVLRLIVQKLELKKLPFAQHMVHVNVISVSATHRISESSVKALLATKA